MIKVDKIDVSSTSKRQFHDLMYVSLHFSYTVFELFADIKARESACVTFRLRI